MVTSESLTDEEVEPHSQVLQLISFTGIYCFFFFLFFLFLFFFFLFFFFFFKKLAFHSDHSCCITCNWLNRLEVWLTLFTPSALTPLLLQCWNMQIGSFWHLCWFDIATLLTPCLFEITSLDMPECHSKNIYLKQQLYLGNFKLCFHIAGFVDKRSHFSRVDSQNFAKMRQMDTPTDVGYLKFHPITKLSDLTSILLGLLVH